MSRSIQLRYEILYVQHGRALAQAIRANEDGIGWTGTDRQIFEGFAAIDPTAAKTSLRKSSSKSYIYLPWLIKTYLDSHERGEALSSKDFPKLTYFLKMFSQRSPEFPEKDRDINQYDFQGLMERISGVEGIGYSSRAMKRQNRAQVDAETTVLYDGPFGRVLIPHSIRACIFWGLNTKWCTQSEVTENRFHYYNADAPLVTFIIEGKKFQVGDSSFYDEEDREVSLEKAPLELVAETLKLYPGLQKVLLEDHNAYDLMSFYQADDEARSHSSHQTPLDLVSINAESFLKLPEKDQNNEDLQIELVTAKPEVLKFIKNQSKKLVLAAIDNDIGSLQHVEEHWTNNPEIMGYATKKAFHAAKYLGEDLLNSEFFLKRYLKIYPEAVLCLPRTPERAQRVREYLKSSGHYIQYAEAYKGDPEMVETALLNDLNAIEFVHQKAWQQIPVASKRKAWGKAIREDWKILSLVYDCEITLSVQDELKIFKMAMEHEEELLEERLHLFPSLRYESFKAVMTAEEALSLLTHKANREKEISLQNSAGLKPC